jgi:DNA-binding response OmpR family regulator
MLRIEPLIWRRPEMTGEADLTGHRILVVEDEYYLSVETTLALQEAGAEVLGPCPSEEAARKEMESRSPSGAVVDINLGSGPSFALAKTLQARGIPFIFVTGYDEAAIPPGFEGVTRLQKPISCRQIVGSLAHTLGLIP